MHRPCSQVPPVIPGSRSAYATSQNYGLSMRRRALEPAAVAWALDEVEAQLRQEPAHRLSDPQREYGWGLTDPNGIGVDVEAVRVAAATSATAEFDLVARATGLLRHARDQRRLLLPLLDGDAARIPALLYLVFETGGQVHVFETLEEAGGSLEALDLTDGHYIGAFSDQGQVITMRPGDLWITFDPSEAFDLTALRILIRGSRTFSELADDPPSVRARALAFKLTL